MTLVVKLSGATFGDELNAESERIYRYFLWRVWDERKASLNIIGLNPSTADENRDDPTIRRCIDFAQRWGWGGLVVTNLFAYRSTNPRALLHVDDPLGPENERHLLNQSDNAGMVIAAWGDLTKQLQGHGKRMASLLAERHQLYCFGLTKHGSPRHPLYIHGDSQPILYRVALPWSA